jgi:NAD(P)H-flavin reductase
MAKSIFRCTVVQNNALSPKVHEIIFKSNRRIKFEAGQFLSVIIPHKVSFLHAQKRMYSLAAPAEISYQEGYRLCVKHVPDGLGSSYVCALKPGDEFDVTAPYGDFVFHKPKAGRGAVFIATGSGIAPIRSILLSKEFQEHRPLHSLVVFGGRDEKEILYPELTRETGVDVIASLSQAGKGWEGFHGRVTDWIRSRPKGGVIAWHDTDFYLCGNPAMIEEVTRILIQGFGVSPTAIYAEAFSSSIQNAELSDSKAA